jgi:hypothetical protein
MYVCMYVCMGKDSFMHCIIHGLQQGKYREEKCMSVRQRDYVVGLKVGESGAKMNQCIGLILLRFYFLRYF